MKRILSILITIAIIFSCVNFNVFAETEGALSISAPTSASPGETINVIVNVPSGTKALSGSFNLVYDNTAFSVETCTSGTILNDMNVAINKTYADNKIRISFDGEQPLTKGGIILNVAFDVLSGASGTVSFNVEKFKLYNENYEQVDIIEEISTQMYIVNESETEMTVNCLPSVNTGDEITVTVDVKNSMNICGGGFNLVYDSTKFALVSAKAGSVLSTFTKQLNKSYASNKVRLTWAGYSAMSEDGTVLSLVFQAKDGVKGLSKFSVEQFNYGDINGATYDGISQSSTVDIICTHNVMNWVVTEKATCIDTGVETFMCGCGYSTDVRDLSALGHVEMEWIITKEATCDDKGTKEHTCVVCGYVDNTEEIEAHGHIYESVITAPTQAEDGFTTHTCTGCGHSYKDSITAATGYTISYNANGGVGAPDAQKKYADETVTLSSIIPSKEGHVFIGWTRTENGTIAEYAAGSTYRDNEDVVLYAVWGVNNHTITYLLDGEIYSTQSYDFGEMIEAVDEPEKEGYTFSGWSEIPISMPNENVTITGSFSINTYNVVFNANSNDVIFHETVVEHGTTVVIPLEIPELENSTFIGWATKPTSRKAEYNPGEKIVIKDNLILYAVWNTMWDGTVAEGFAGGNGTITNPYRIENASQLLHMSEKINSGDESYRTAYYILTNNITFFDISGFENWDNAYSISNWTPIGTSEHPFSGVFDGNGYIIKGIYINKGTHTDEYNNQGLFGFVDGATISNIGITDSYIRGYDNVGMLVANAVNVKIKNSYNTGTVIGNNNVGGLVGSVSEGSTTNISGCYNRGKISGNEYIGGICGCINKSIIYSCYNKADIIGIRWVGGVLGKGDGAYVSTSYNTGNIGDDTTHSLIGGVCGYLESSKVELCYNVGKVSAYSHDFAGIVGFAGYGTSVSRSYNVGDITGTGTSGGIVGAMYYTSDSGTSNIIENCLNTGKITSTANVGGICGYLLENSTIIRCINLGTVSANSATGAISGYLSGNVSYSYYISGCGSATSGTALSWKQMQLGNSFEGFSDNATGLNMHDRWTLQNNPYTAFPTLRNNDALTATPIEFDLNGGYFDEYVYSIRTYAKGTNVDRSLNSLIVYNTANTTSGTNSYGREVVVNSRNEVVSKGGNNNTVPFGGFVLSGNGVSSIWIDDNIEVGDKVYYNTSNCEIKVFKKNPKFTCSYGFVSYLPTPHKDGYVFGGWYDENDNLITYATKIYATDTLKLHAKWSIPESVAETSYGTLTYKLFDTATSYASAQRYCESIGGHLATITDELENDEIYAMLSKGTKSGYLIGSNDILSEGTFAWETGETMSFTNWSSSEPSDSTPGEDVVEIYTSNGMWNDIKDTYLSNRGFICEFDNYKPSSEFIYNGHLYQIYHSYENGVSWDYAKEFCESKGGHLVTITSEEENNALVDALTKYSSTISNISRPTPFFWLGATDVESEGDWKWVTGEEWSYTNWNDGQPDNAGGKENYLHVYTENSRFAKWNDLPNTYSTGVSFICEYDAIYPVATAEFNDHKYMVYDTFVTWENAQEYCESIGGHLATITNEEENAFVSNLCIENTSVDDFYLGGTDEITEGTWKWITGENWSYTAWNDGEPNNSSSSEHYLQMFLKSNSGLWNDIPNKYISDCGFICEIDPAEEVGFKSGTHENISWTLEDGVLYLSGEGIIKNSSVYPWDKYKEIISNIVIAEGVTDVGYAFINLTNVIENISIPKTVTNFPENFGYGKITNATYLGSKYDFNRLIPVESSDFSDTSMIYGEYTIIYDGLSVRNVNVGGETKIIDAIPEKDGYEFLGWTTSKTLSSLASSVEYNPGDTITPEKDTTLYAVWRKNKFNITYVTAMDDEYGEWGEWQDETITNTATINVDKRYRSRSKETTTSTTSKTLDGWTYSHTSTRQTGWINSGTTKVDTINTISQRREVQTKYVPPVKKTQYHYFVWYDASGGIWTYNRNGNLNLAEIWIDYELPLNRTSGGMEIYGGSGYNFGYPINRWYKADGSANGFPTSSTPYFTREVQVSEGYFEYYYRDTFYTYHFVKYGEWGEWQDEPINSSSSVNVGIQYRQRKVDQKYSFVEENSRNGNITSELPANKDFYCIGWSTDVDSTEAEYVAGDEIELNSDVVLYAIWKEGGEGIVDDSISWQVEGNTLFIYGKGEILDYTQASAPWYEHKDKITNIVLSEDISYIGDYAFYGLDNLISVEMSGVTTIGDYAFSNCSSLKTLDISKVIDFGSYAFRYCVAMNEITIASESAKYGNSVFSNCTGITNVIINDGITAIPSGLLSNCGTIANISIPDSIVSIESNAFIDTTFATVTYMGTKNSFAELLVAENTLTFNKVTCVAENKTFLFTDFFVETINIASISLEKKSLGLYVGEKVMLATQVTPANATETVLWKSDNEQIAIVDDFGNVTALKEGIANITVASESELVKASCVVYVSAGANEDKATIYCDSIEEIKNGKSFDVNISLKNNPGIASMRLSLTYDTSVMSLTSVKDLGLIGESIHSTDYNTDNYTLYWDNGTATSNFTADGAIVTLTFTIKSDAKSGDYPIIVDYDFNNDDIVNCELIPVKFEIVNGFVTVKSFVYGDVNDDGKVNPLDSAYLSRYLAKWPGVTINLDAADANGDGKVNPLDSAILKRHIAKWPEYASLPYQN